MVIGMAANILIARFSNLKFIFLTGHHTLYMAALISVVLSVAGLEGVLLYVISFIFLAQTIVGKIVVKPGQFPLRWSDAFNLSDDFKKLSVDNFVIDDYKEKHILLLEGFIKKSRTIERKIQFEYKKSFNSFVLYTTSLLLKL